jgi:ABC-type proline/glycine betaine transport system ATPase subunit
MSTMGLSGIGKSTVSKLCNQATQRNLNAWSILIKAAS